MLRFRVDTQQPDSPENGDRYKAVVGALAL